MIKVNFKIQDAFNRYCGGYSYEKNKLGKEKLAKKMGIPKGRVAQIINGTYKKVKFIEIVTLAAELDVEITELYEIGTEE